MEIMVKLTGESVLLVLFELTYKEKSSDDAKKGIEPAEHNPTAEAGRENHELVDFPKENLGGSVDITWNLDVLHSSTRKVMDACLFSARVG